MDPFQPPKQMDEEAQADFPEGKEEEEQSLKIKACDRIKLYPKVPPELSAYGKYSNYSRPWILQDGRSVPREGSEMRDSYKIPKRLKPLIGKWTHVNNFNVKMYCVRYNFLTTKAFSHLNRASTLVSFMIDNTPCTIILKQLSKYPSSIEIRIAKLLYKPSNNKNRAQWQSCSITNQRGKQFKILRHDWLWILNRTVRNFMLD